MKKASTTHVTPLALIDLDINELDINELEQRLELAPLAADWKNCPTDQCSTQCPTVCTLAGG